MLLALAAGGGTIGAITGDYWKRSLGTARLAVVIAWSVALLWSTYLLTPSLPILAAISAGLFFCTGAWSAIVVTYRVARVPDELQGRVNSVARLVINTSAPVGAIITGILSDRLGLTATLLVIVAGLTLLALWATIDVNIRPADTTS